MGEYLLICAAAFLASGLTFFSGFGLGTLLFPAFAVFFPVDVAIGLTAVVHLLNNLFKLALVGRHAVKRVILMFGLPAVLAAVPGAWLLGRMTDWGAIASWTAGERSFDVLPIKLTIGLLLAVFALFDLVPRLRGMQFSPRWLIPGGAISGFFGGLSGHQGALRSAFLLKAGLSKDGFIASGVVIACMIDVSRISLYARGMMTDEITAQSGLLSAAVLAAFCGAYLGNKWLKKMTMSGLQKFIGALLLLFSALMMAGIV
jgi:uncharacterized protein